MTHNCTTCGNSARIGDELGCRLNLTPDTCHVDEGTTTEKKDTLKDYIIAAFSIALVTIGILCFCYDGASIAPNLAGIGIIALGGILSQYSSITRED